MMETKLETCGFGGGFADAEAPWPERLPAPLVQVRGVERANAVAKKDARPKLQLRTGASNCRKQMTEDSLAHMPRWRRWGLYAAFALVLSGIAPALLANALIALFEALGWWLLLPAFAAALHLAWQALWA